MSGANDVAAEKAAWRRRFRALRAETPPGPLADASAQIVARLRALPEVATARTVHLFWPLPGEVDLRPLARSLRAEGRTVVLPAVVGPRALAQRVFEGDERLTDGPWGLKEPAPDARSCHPRDLDVVLVPGLAFGRDGSRLGYGGGFYDTFLAETTALRVGVGLQSALVATVPTLPHDACLDTVVTEGDVVRV
ncbi:5-formyltetrahydrofolate cyclo-ligase [Rubrivirga sp. SAORIC476]|uniref:5-formyltetrahydrofolate cyclo-ligase n=1 Tax=Rubrivirga sp. SAORIC476 TaxID=1961794 RepID=UPI000BA8F8E2|nr:5-formyltetrahydrofolate cyclo-ligase [Rubrivirga sp. SAORIC476]PAP80947.1 5-formyltetrahydrofolate cyclo-ligase [Rubrivirga sp. SAORIC476]